MAKHMPCGYHVHWKSPPGKDYLSKVHRSHTNRPKAAEWLYYLSMTANITIIHADRDGYEKKVGYKGYPVDGMDDTNKVVYEFDGVR